MIDSKSYGNQQSILTLHTSTTSRLPRDYHTMPSLYSNTMLRQMPPTPPDYCDSLSSNAHSGRHLPGLHLSKHNSRSHDYELDKSDSRDATGQYFHHGQTRSGWPTSQETSRHAPCEYQGPCLDFPNSYGAASAPLLPPIKVPDRSMEDYQQYARSKRAPAAVQPREEKAVGGVAAHLDYEMEEMVDFVSKTAQGLYDIYASEICLADIDLSRSFFDSKAPIYPDFRKYVSQVLSSTRLPSSTIILGIHYLATRMTMLSDEGNYKHGNGQVHRMLTIALLLGSKFLDDNTFQNRSWSEVSNIPVRDINILEVEWLVAIDWNMHVKPNDSDGFGSWHQQWQRHQMAKVNKVKIDPLAQSLKQAHLGSVPVQKDHFMHHRSSPTSLHTPSYADRAISQGFKAGSQSQWSTAAYDSFPTLRSHTDYSPPSAPETGPNTPNWFGPQSRFGFGRESQQTYPTLKMPTPLQVVGSNFLQSDFHLPYAQTFNAPGQGHGHGHNCACPFCLSQHNHFLLASGYGMQPVVG